jgi:hypothetical protein
VSIFEVGVHRQFGRHHDLGDVPEHALERHAAVRKPHRKRGTAAGGRQRAKSQVGEVTCRTGIPGVRHHETPAFMQALKLGAFLGGG